MKGITGSFSSWRTNVSAPARNTLRSTPEAMQQIRNTSDEPLANPYVQYDKNPGGQYRIPHTDQEEQRTTSTSSNLAMINYLLKSIENEESFDTAMLALQQHTEFGTPHFQHMVITQARDHIQKGQNKLLAEEAISFLARNKEDCRSERSEIATLAWMKQRSKLDLKIVLLQRVIDSLLT